jgi:RNA polymerase sigma-70 factor (ECF subfamily)
LKNHQADTALIKGAMDGDRKAAKQLYDTYKHSLFMVCLRYAKDRDQAQDYLQESFISIFKNLNQFDSLKGAFESWAKRIAINVCLMDIRKSSLYSVSITEAEPVEDDTSDALSEMSLQEMLDLIRQLPEGYKTVFNMYVIDGFSHKEIAAELGISINTSKTQLMKARTLLQKKILNNRQYINQNHG